MFFFTLIIVYYHNIRIFVPVSSLSPVESGKSKKFTAYVKKIA